ncbi:MAG: DUF3793 family protein [Clostridiales bacterium]|nr:DUF3793 family protein [Clostridiales bacterium]
MPEAFNNMLVKYCSPVLTGIKTANMFTFFGDPFNIDRIIKSYNENFNSFGIYFYILNSKDKSSLIYVYRFDRLKRDLRQRYVSSFMEKEGYDIYDVKSCIETLSEKIRKGKEFPHEIGLFLSYPIYDVIGFIRNNGCNFKYCGFWKVYSNEENAKRVFREYEKCTALCCKKFSKERNLFNIING